MLNSLMLSPDNFEGIIAELLGETFDLPVAIGDLWNADKCPEHLLPWLAHQFSVDVWRDGWDLQTKRHVIKSSIYNHSIKGTRKSIKNALLALGIVADVKAWHELDDVGSPYSFEVVAWVNKQIEQSEYLIHPELYVQISQMIDAHKSARDEYVFKVGTYHASILNVRSVITNHIFVEFSGATYVPEYENDIKISNAFSNYIFLEYSGVTI
ncbi:MAG: phage tail protein I [Rhizobiales bacterium]|nr:phage tail protein I [Hyphomicrobiales bacterium]